MNREPLKIADYISLVFIFLFTYTAASKLFSHVQFRMTLSQSPLLGGVAAVLAYVIPAVELFIVAMLVDRRSRRAGLSCCLALMVVFTGYVGYMLVAVPEGLPCSCGGVLQQLSWGQHFWLNVLLTGLAAWGVTAMRGGNQKHLKFLLQ